MSRSEAVRKQTIETSDLANMTLQKREQLSYLNADSPHKLCCNCRAHNKNIITHSILSPAFVMMMGYRQVVRHSTLTAVFAGSNPTSPVCRVAHVPGNGLFYIDPPTKTHLAQRS